MSLYDTVRSSVDQSGAEERVEVNQRALIDKILARYASAGAVYRELIQNSNDAEATKAEVRFTTLDDLKKTVTSVEYRNNGMPFRPQDWSRLKKIAEGNPDESKIGAFGVGAYTMFSICEEPLVLSGKQALAFVWRGDALYTKTITTDKNKNDGWTCFVLPARDPYPLPSLQEFGEFLCASLTFTKCLSDIKVYVNDKLRMTITKTQIQEPTPVQIQKSTGWFKSDGALTSSSSGLFSLKDEFSLLESFYHVQVTCDGETASVTARYLSAIAKTKIPSSMVKRMERVTKKKPPSKVEVQIFISGQEQVDRTTRNKASSIVQSFSPKIGQGRIFIGFRTSQTTGLAAHLAAPFVPTVEREAMDLQDTTLRVFNLELLEFSGILMRLTLEHGMARLGVEYEQGAAKRAKEEQELLKKQAEKDLKRQETDDTDATTDTTATEESGTSSSMWGFAKFMAKGVKKTIVKVTQTMTDSDELLYPRDPRPLCKEETEAIVLMQSFCPRQSTPDPLVGTALAQGFSNCFASQAPPVLTRSGVVPGDQARLPNKGMEAFCKQGVIRTVVYENAQEYHNVICPCQPLTLTDLSNQLSKDILTEEQVVRLLKWWVKFSRVQTHSIPSYQGVEIKEKIRFTLGKNTNDISNNALPIFQLKQFLFYLDESKIPTPGSFSVQDLPMPNSILPKSVQDQVTLRTVSDSFLNVWFSPLPMELWIDFIASHTCMNSGQPEDETLRLRVLAILSQEYSKRSYQEQAIFGSYCQSVFKEKRCIPFDSSEPTAYAADYPSNLYLYSAKLAAFDGIGNFHKVSQHLNQMNIRDEFLVALGVRKSVAIDFLFANLDTLKWSNDPKPLVEYLKSATLTSADMQKLKTTRYLPAEQDVDKMYAPKELYLPNAQLRLFPFCRLLQWPSGDDLTERSLNGKFLMSLGMHVLPPLKQVLQYLSKEEVSREVRIQCLDFVTSKLGSSGDYFNQYNQLTRNDKVNCKFLPCTTTNPLDGSRKGSLYSVLTCCYQEKCAVMGFPIIDPSLGDKAKLYGSLFQCVPEPAPNALIQKLQMLVKDAKKLLKSPSGMEPPSETEISQEERVLNAFDKIFWYLSGRSTDMSASSLKSLAKEAFIPCLVDSRVEWFYPDQVFFKNDAQESLFHVVEFCPFLAAAGVQQEASTKDIFKLMIANPQKVLQASGEVKYKQFLRRVAAHRPFTRVTKEIQESPFLLAYSKQDETDTMKGELTTANDVYIIDNSFFGRMFPVKRAPQESDLEDFYALIGSKYISKQVVKKYHVVGDSETRTALTKALRERIQERGPLLVSPSITSRPLVSNAAKILEESKLEIKEAPSLKAVYSLNQSVRSQKITCCAIPSSRNKNSLYVTQDFDWFDVGNAIGELILQRCQLEDAFFISSLLEAPLEQLRNRGFPVDRIIEPPPPPEEPKKVPVPEATPVPDNANGTAGTTPASAAPPAGAASAPAVPPPQPADTRRDKREKEEQAAAGGASVDEYMTVLPQIFPNVDKKFLRDKLGDNPTLDHVRRVAEDMTMNGYPKEEEQEEQPKETKKRDSKFFGSKKLGKAMEMMSSAAGVPNPFFDSGGAAGPGMAGPPGHSHPSESQAGKSPEMDAFAHHNMEKQLEQQVRHSRDVDISGHHSPEHKIESVPPGIDRGDTCEIMEGKDLIPFCINGKNQSHNGITLFSARTDASSQEFLARHLDAVESFAVVLERLCDVYGLKLSSICIYHESSGTIAFNSHRSLHFNFYWYHALNHFDKNATSACYSYWYVVAAHELAHNFVSAHNRDHGYYTESYCMHYLPKLMALLSKL